MMSLWRQEFCEDGWKGWICQRSGILKWSWDCGGTFFFGMKYFYRVQCRKEDVFIKKISIAGFSNFFMNQVFCQWIYLILAFLLRLFLNSFIFHFFFKFQILLILRIFLWINFLFNLWPLSKLDFFEFHSQFSKEG